MPYVAAADRYDRMLAYLRDTPGVRDVVVSGGDSRTMARRRQSEVRDQRPSCRSAVTRLAKPAVLSASAAMVVKKNWPVTDPHATERRRPPARRSAPADRAAPINAGMS